MYLFIDCNHTFLLILLFHFYSWFKDRGTPNFKNNSSHLLCLCSNSFTCCPCMCTRFVQLSALIHGRAAVIYYIWLSVQLKIYLCYVMFFYVEKNSFCIFQLRYSIKTILETRNFTVNRVHALLRNFVYHFTL